MTTNVEEEFAARGVRRGRVLMLPPPVAFEFIEATRRAGQRILGVDSFILTQSTTMSPLEHILDLSRAGAADDTWVAARQFIREREHLGLLFEIVV